VMPGNDDTRTHRADSYVRDRRGGDFYRETWNAAFSTYPDWIIITSWNEWVEGTMIEPSVSYGNLYLDITRQFAGQFKAGLPTPTPVPTRTPTPTPSPSPTGASEPPDSTDNGPPIGLGATTTLSDTLRVRVGPSTDSEIVGRLRPGAAIKILARNDDSTWWEIAYPDSSQRGWVAAEFVTVTGDTSTLPLADAAGTPSAVASPSGTPDVDASETVTETVTGALTPAVAVTDTPTWTLATTTVEPSATESPAPTLTLAAPTAAPKETPSPTSTTAAAPLPAQGLLQTLFGWLPFH
ncbi:MAG: SH3 domain-containing protein, partial [Chloroflexi bacterium]|nr:SH3 domain-containing protein [Chloroflexota bacterium]